MMKLHHSKHHQAYMNSLNAAEEAYAAHKEQIKFQPARRFNGGGHSLFWKNPGRRRAQVWSAQGRARSVDTFKKMNTVMAAFQGHEWGWLGYNPETKELEVVTTPNQNSLLSHAFYLQYDDVKADYVTAIWNVINFKEAEPRFPEAAKSA